ncbi:hypothetical protein O0235_01835 [Tepidiforma flava]|uniref:Universal stress protein n=1 Tax=Tepidiforma flava TaxID=3004094 RepID=A0ABY7M867_9CHLR|nr:hypothetical protein [Tepidiforma flava]WBL36342.1 hypothetical protein O0235_01835 [Tepidiforma flava]
MPGSDRLRIAWLTTGRGPGSFGALDYLFGAIDRGLPVEVAVVFVNRERGEAEPTDRLIAMAEGRGAPVELLSSVAFRKARGGKVGRPGSRCSRGGTSSMQRSRGGWGGTGSTSA